MIAIIDYGLGNLGSISNMLKVLGEKNIITNNHDKLRQADKLILPGVGAFDAGMSNLKESRLVSLLQEESAKGKPILGICLGMQLLGMKSEEGSLPGLGLIPFECKRFDFAGTEYGGTLRIPHMGWDVVDVTSQCLLTTGLENDIRISSDIDNTSVSSGTEKQRYYFVHTYYARCQSQDYEFMSCDYGVNFSAGVYKGNVYGVQFHPEKSHDFGMKLLKSFANIN